jgi:hypothetical protein
MLFVIIGYDGPRGAELRPAIRPAHLDNLRPYSDRGKVKIAGPLTDGAGSLIVMEFETEAEALAFAHGDPYTTGGVFERIAVHPFRQVFPE